jgi:very-short-patch-repair endonuclease
VPTLPVSYSGQNVKTVPVLHHRARILRRNQTDAEAKLWACLRARRFSDFRFRRQFPIANFIADFACPRAKLVIELDGGQHLKQAAKDAWRTRLIEVRGYRVIRFWDHEVLIEIDAVLERIYEELRGADPTSLHHD